MSSDSPNNNVRVTIELMLTIGVTIVVAHIKELASTKIGQIILTITIACILTKLLNLM